MLLYRLAPEGFYAAADPDEPGRLRTLYSDPFETLPGGWEYGRDVDPATASFLPPLRPGKIVATDNGDPTSFEPFQEPRRHAFNGLCLAIVRAKPGEAGDIRLTVTSAGLRAAGAVIAASGND